MHQWRAKYNPLDCTAQKERVLFQVEPGIDFWDERIIRLQNDIILVKRGKADVILMDRGETDWGGCTPEDPEN